MKTKKQTILLSKWDNKRNNINKVPIIIIDDRERRLADELSKTDAKLIIKRLEIGDALTSETTVIERKTRDDFEASIMDKRLFFQLEQMREFKTKIVIIEGKSNKINRIKKTAILGAYASILTDYSAGIFFTKNIKSTAEMIYAIARHEQIALKRDVGYLAKKKALTFKQMQLRIVEALPGVGPELAKNILDTFGTLENIFNARPDELSKIEKIGEKRSKIIWNLIHRKTD